MSESGKAYAAINLNEGGRLFDLKLDDRPVIQEHEDFPYTNSSASAIMFPFVNRIQDGMYSFEGKTYQITCNEPSKNNAIHGLLYTRKFEVYKKQVSVKAAILTLKYDYDGTTQGFPFPFDFFVTYTITEKTALVKMKVINTGKKTFPFTIGWHPYFTSENLYESYIDFDCDEEYTTTDDRSITNGTKPHELNMPFQLKNHPFDTAYTLKNIKIGFHTPSYKLTITGNAAQNFVQFFTPATKNIIAIEPTVGLSNSFNNHIGLQTLLPNKTYKIEWNVEVETKN
ncbi:aldose 1-epimerase [Kordia sp. SMS9]|uniref:aldose 1-epimerase n=1 Tax=Kordia sp. SMS9 TaxID=2282170 RepID=UPI0013B45BBF|nr:aldose 1-epimerase [Kordia sp. SMS9]